MTFFLPPSFLVQPLFQLLRQQRCCIPLDSVSATSFIEKCAVSFPFVCPNDALLSLFVSYSGLSAERTAAIIVSPFFPLNHERFYPMGPSH